MNIVIIPAYQPNVGLKAIVEEMHKCGYQVIVVDDGSGNAYAPVFEAVKEKGVVLTHSVNQGKGCAIKTALSYIQKHFPEDSGIVTMDADGQHSISDVCKVSQMATKEKDALCIGVRAFDGSVPFRSRIGNLITREIFYIGNKVRIGDTQTGLRAFSATRITELLQVTGSRYEYEMNVLSYCARNKIPIRQIPIQTIYIDNGNTTSHFRVIRDSFLIYKDIIKFTFSSAMSFVVDYICFCLLCFMLAGMPYGVLLSNVVARIISAAFNYTVNATFVFKTKKRNLKSVLQYALLALFILTMNNIILEGCMRIAMFPPMFAKIITELILFCISFLIQHLIIFRKKTR